MSDHLVRAPRWARRTAAALFTVMFAVVLVKSVQSDGRSLGFAFGVNWLLMVWAIVVGRFVLFRLPAGYYTLRQFEKSGRIYDRLGVRWYQRWFRRFVWSVNLSLGTAWRGVGALQRPAQRLSGYFDAADPCEIGATLFSLVRTAGFTTLIGRPSPYARI
jgi:hypothetical protein